MPKRKSIARVIKVKWGKNIGHESPDPVENKMWFRSPKRGGLDGNDGMRGIKPKKRLTLYEDGHTN